MFVAKHVNDRAGTFKVRCQRVKDARSLYPILAVIRGVDVRAVRSIAETVVEVPCNGRIDGKAIVATKQRGELCPIS